MHRGNFRGDGKGHRTRFRLRLDHLLCTPKSRVEFPLIVYIRNRKREPPPPNRRAVKEGPQPSHQREKREKNRQRLDETNLTEEFHRIPQNSTRACRVPFLLSRIGLYCISGARRT